MTQTTFSKGLEGVIAAESRVCDIDGEKGLLSYRGYDIRDLAENSNFSETAYLLLYGKLPTATELEHFDNELRKRRAIDDSVLNVLKSLPRSTHSMVALQTAVAALGAIEPLTPAHDQANFERALGLVSKFATIVAAWKRIAEGQEPVAPRDDLGHGQNFLYMLNGKAPDAETGMIFDVCLILHMEHSFNASTFTARVVAGTMAPLDQCISAAVGALYGPLHGGANEGVLDQIETIPSVDAVEGWALDMLRNKAKIMGMGHRVYRAKDPRSYVLEGHLHRIAEKLGGNENYEKLKRLEEIMRREMEAAGKKIYPNVDFFSGSLYELLGIPRDLFTAIFAVARIVGWVAHVMEQWEDNRLYRPKALYTGDADMKWAPFESR